MSVFDQTHRIDAHGCTGYSGCPVHDFPPGVDMCRDCGQAHLEGPCPEDCEHKRVSQEDWGGEERAFLCLDCDNWVSPTGPEDEEGHPTWEIP